MANARAFLVVCVSPSAAECQDGLSVENLARRLKITRGSFYHHFSNHHQFLCALLDAWEEQQTAQIIAASSSAKVLSERAEILLNAVVSVSHDLDAAVRDPLVCGYQARVDKRHIAYTVYWHQCCLGKASGLETNYKAKISVA